MYSYNLHASFFILLLILQQTQIFSCHDCYADSTVLAYVLSELNRRHKYCLDLFLLSVDEGITGYRDDSLETVKRNEIQVPLPSATNTTTPVCCSFCLLILVLFFTDI